MNWEDFKAKYGDRPKDIIFALAFQEGKEMGIREVVEWIQKHTTKMNTNMYGISLGRVEWQAFLKEKGIKEAK